MGVLGVGVDADELAAGEGGHLDLLVPAGVGGQLGGPGVVSPDVLNGHRVPHAADAGYNGAVPDALQKLRVRPVGEGGAGGDGQHGLGYIHAGDGAVGTVPGTVIGKAVVVQAHLQAGVAEERVHVPGGGPVHGHQASGVFRRRQNAVQALYVLLREVGLIIIEEVTVVCRQGIGVEGAVYAGGLHRRGEAGGSDLIRAFHRVQSAGGGQGGHLVVGKGEYVRPALQVSQKNVLAVGLALGVVCNAEDALGGVAGLEGGEDLLEEGLVLLRSPDRQFHGLYAASAALRRRRCLFAGGQGEQHP